MGINRFNQSTHAKNSEKRRLPLVVIFLRIDRFAAPPEFQRTVGTSVTYGYDRLGRFSSLAVHQAQFRIQASKDGGTISSLALGVLLNGTELVPGTRQALDLGTRVQVDDLTITLVPLITDRRARCHLAPRAASHELPNSPVLQRLID